MVSGAQMAGETRPFVFETLPGWGQADHALAWRLYSDVRLADTRRHLETAFDIKRLTVHVTGYFEPEFTASLTPTAAHPAPIYHMVPGLSATRQEIEQKGLLQGHEIAWLDPLDAFFLQVQGSGRLMLPGGPLRVGFAGKNGRAYVSIGKLLVERGQVAAADISAQAIRDWCAAHPDQMQALLWENPAFVCFQPLDLAPDLGPLGTLGVPLMPLYSVAVDPTVIPLGTLLWLDCPAHRGLVVAQDTGSAITGARIDLFCGTGAGAGDMAGPLNTAGTALIFTPKVRP